MAHLPDGRGRTAAASVRRDSRPDQRAARSACRNRVHMTRNPPRSAKSNAGDRKGVSENASRDALSGRIGLFGRAIRPARSTTRGSEAEIAWKVAFGCFSLTGGKPNGECRVSSPSAQNRPNESHRAFRSRSVNPLAISAPAIQLIAAASEEQVRHCTSSETNPKLK